MSEDQPSVAPISGQPAWEMFYDYSRGTLWRIREDVWREFLPNYSSGRYWHPGLSSRGVSLGWSGEFVPMLHGTSGRRGPVVAHGLTKERGTDYPTSFGHIVIPAQVPLARFGAAGAAPCGVRDAAPEPRWWETSSVLPNHDKPRLEAKEMAQFDAWSRQREKFGHG